MRRKNRGEMRRIDGDVEEVLGRENAKKYVDEGQRRGIRRKG